MIGFSEWGMLNTSVPTWFLFFLKVHEEVTKSWKDPFSGRSRSSDSSTRITLHGGAVKGYEEIRCNYAHKVLPSGGVTRASHPRLTPQRHDASSRISSHSLAVTVEPGKCYTTLTTSTMEWTQYSRSLQPK